MVDTVDSHVLFSGNNLYHIRLTGYSDGTGESDVVKVDKSALTGPLGVEPEKMKIEYMSWDISGWDAVTLEWDGSTDTVGMVLSTNGYEDFKESGGLISDNADGTGDLLLTTNGTGAAGYSYVITLRLRLKGGV